MAIRVTGEIDPKLLARDLAQVVIKMLQEARESKTA